LNDQLVEPKQRTLNPALAFFSFFVGWAHECFSVGWITDERPSCRPNQLIENLGIGQRLGLCELWNANNSRPLTANSSNLYSRLVVCV
jgi:hypothetical protein